MNTRLRSPRSEAVRRAKLNAADADAGRRLPAPIPVSGGWSRTHMPRSFTAALTDAVEIADLIADAEAGGFDAITARRRLEDAGIAFATLSEPPRLPPPISPAARGGSTVGAVVEAARSAAASADSLTTDRADDMRVTNLGRSSAVEAPQGSSTGVRAGEGPAPALSAKRDGHDPVGRAAGAEGASTRPSARATPTGRPAPTSDSQGCSSGVSPRAEPGEPTPTSPRTAVSPEPSSTAPVDVLPALAGAVAPSVSGPGTPSTPPGPAAVAAPGPVPVHDGARADGTGPGAITRRDYLGSADIGMVVGVSTFGGPWHVWAHKCEDLPDDESEILRVGLELEEGIARLWAWKNGATLIRKGSLILHPDDPTMGATPDFWARLADGRVGIVECKNVGPGGRANWTDDDGDAIPQSVVAQTTWQAGIALAAGERVEFVAVARLEFGCRIKSAWLDHDPELFDELFAAGRAFWAAHVVTRTPPPLDGSEAATDHLTRRHPKGNGVWLEATTERAALVRALKDAKAATKEAERAEEEAKQHVLTAIGDAEGIEGHAKWSVEVGRVSWKDIADAVAKGAPLDQKTIRAHTGAGSRSLRLLGGK